MTLVLSAHARDTLWLVADRRLWYGPRRKPSNTAVKVMILETTDGVGVLGRAGLGATPHGTQPSERMSAVLRGRGGLTFEQTLAMLSEAANRELPKHLAGIPGGAHFIIVPAFVTGIGPRLYSMDNVVNRRTGKHWYRYTSHQPTEDRGIGRGFLAFGGTGGIYLASNRARWQRPLRGLLKAHDRGKVSDYVIADQLARLNYEAHRSVRDGTVGAECIVVWRRRKGARQAATRGGGAHQFYAGTNRERDSAAIPTISNGMDLQALVGAITPEFQKLFASLGSNAGASVELDHDEINRRLAEIPSEPDEKLR